MSWFIVAVATGSVLFFVGMAINIHSDHILRTLRLPGETDYKIPRGLMCSLSCWPVSLIVSDVTNICLLQVSRLLQPSNICCTMDIVTEYCIVSKRVKSLKLLLIFTCTLGSWQSAQCAHWCHSIKNLLFKNNWKLFIVETIYYCPLCHQCCLLSACSQFVVHMQLIPKHNQMQWRLYLADTIHQLLVCHVWLRVYIKIPHRWFSLHR